MDFSGFDLNMFDPSTFSDEDRAECQRYVESNGVEGYLQYLKSTEEKWKTVPLTIAILGNSGVGKSSFINAMRGLTADDEGAAEVGVTETTTDPQAFSHPNNPLLQFWDLPGVGTPKFPREQYLEKIQVDKFDFFLILSATRFTQDDAWLGREISKRNKKFYYIRTKTGVDIRNNKESHPKTHNETDVLNKIRRSTKDNLRDDDTPVFLIDSHDRQRFDFSQLEESLVNDFPKFKRSALIMSMSVLSKEIVQLKVTELRSRIWKVASVSAAVAIVPIPGLSVGFDTALVIREGKLYQQQLGLDDESLRRLANVTATDLNNLRAIATKLNLSFSIEGIKLLAKFIPASAIPQALEEVARFIPLVGNVVAAPLSFGATYCVLNIIIRKLEKTALEVMDFVHNQVTDEPQCNDDEPPSMDNAEH